MNVKLQIEEFRNKYSRLKPSEVRAKLKADVSFKSEIEDLYSSVFHLKLNKGCGNCWEDAFIVLCTNKIDNMITLSKRQFELKAGALLIDNKDNTKMASRHNLTDELAIYHLSKNPKCIKLFSVYPENWQEIVKKASAINSDAHSDRVATNSSDLDSAKKAVIYAKRYMTLMEGKVKKAESMEEGADKESALAKANENLSKARLQLSDAEMMVEDIQRSLL